MNPTILTAVLLAIMAVAWAGSVVAVILTNARISGVKSQLDQLAGEARSDRRNSLKLGHLLITATTNFYSFMRKHRHASVTLCEFEKQQNGEPASASARYGIVPSSELRGAVRQILNELQSRRKQDEAAAADSKGIAPAAERTAAESASAAACATAEAEEVEGADDPGMDAPVEEIKPAYRPKVEHCCNPGRNGCSSRTSPAADV